MFIRKARRSQTPSNTVARDQGFTLIELIVVIVVIGVLAGVAIPTFLAQKQSAQDASVKSDLANAAIAAEAYSASHNGSYSGLTAGLLTVPEYQVKSSPSNVILVEAVSTTSYTLKAYNADSGANRIWWLSGGTISGPTN